MSFCPFKEAIAELGSHLGLNLSTQLYNYNCTYIEVKVDIILTSFISVILREHSQNCKCLVSVWVFLMTKSNP